MVVSVDDSKSLHEKWLFHQTSMKKWWFGVSGTSSKCPKCLSFSCSCRKKPWFSSSLRASNILIRLSREKEGGAIPSDMYLGLPWLLPETRHPGDEPFIKDGNAFWQTYSLLLDLHKKIDSTWLKHHLDLNKERDGDTRLWQKFIGILPTLFWGNKYFEETLLLQPTMKEAFHLMVWLPRHQRVLLFIWRLLGLSQAPVHINLFPLKRMDTD